MAGIEAGLWNVAGGNHQIPQALLERSEAKLIKGEVVVENIIQLKFKHFSLCQHKNYTFCITYSDILAKLIKWEVIVLNTINPLYAG